MKICFEKQDTALLQETIAKMPYEEASYHMKRCVDSGLWIPDAKQKQQMANNENIGNVEGVYSVPEGKSESAGDKEAEASS